MSKLYNKNKNLIADLFNCFNSDKMFYSIFFGMAAYIHLTNDLKEACLPSHLW